MLTKVLIPLDGSELAEQVLPPMIDLAQRTGAELVLLRVPDTPTFDYLAATPTFGERLRSQAEAEAAQYLDQMGRKLRAHDLKVSTRLGWGATIYDTILDTAQAVGADMIAMSTHGRSGLARLVMGSVADDVVRHSKIPVMLVRPHRHPDDPPSQTFTNIPLSMS